MTTNKKEDAVFDVLVQSAAELSDKEVAAEYREEGEELSVVASRACSRTSAQTTRSLVSTTCVRGFLLWAVAR